MYNVYQIYLASIHKYSYPTYYKIPAPPILLPADARNYMGAFPNSCKYVSPIRVCWAI